MDTAFLGYDLAVWLAVVTSVFLSFVVCFILGRLGFFDNPGIVGGFVSLMVTAGVFLFFAEQVVKPVEKAAAETFVPKVIASRVCASTPPADLDEKIDSECYPHLASIKTRVEKFRDEFYDKCMNLINNPGTCASNQRQIVGDAIRSVNFQGHTWATLYSIFYDHPNVRSNVLSINRQDVRVYPLDWNCEDAQSRGLIPKTIDRITRQREACRAGIHTTQRREVWRIEDAECYKQWEQEVNTLSCNNVRQVAAKYGVTSTQ